MPVRSLPGLGVRKKHLKEVGVTHTTLERYKTAVDSFFVWRTNNNLEVALSYSCLDFQVGEYFNDLYRRFMPLHYAGDCLSGMKRLFPHTRKHLDTAGLYYKNWVKVTKRRKTLPLSSELVRAMAAYAVGKGEVRFAVCLLLAFVGLLRTGEVVSLEMRHLNILGPELLVVALGDTKTGKRSGHVEKVLIKDKFIIECIAQIKSRCSPDARLYRGDYKSFRNAYVEAGRFFGVVHPRLTPHGLRRGGATWHFCLFKNYDATMALGRWSQLKAARVYIDEAVCEEVASWCVAHATMGTAASEKRKESSQIVVA